MNFLNNLIKRPNSSLLSSPDANSSSTESASNSSNSQQSPRMDADLENLFESATKDLDNLAEQHNQLINLTEFPALPMEDKSNGTVKTPTTTAETIPQLLCDINVNLDQVSAIEMEHLQAMSLELSPLAVKASPRHSMEQQKALVAAMMSKSQPCTPTAPTTGSCDSFSRSQTEVLKFAGLPEFDESQIPEIAPLSAEMEAQLKSEGGAASLLNTVDNDYNSDSEVFAECLSLNSGKLSAEPSELEAYSSALMELQSSNMTATALENTVSHNDSCEPMDVDDVPESMEILKDAIQPGDLKMFINAIIKEEELLKSIPKAKEPLKEEVKLEQTVPNIAEQLQLLSEQSFQIDQLQECELTQPQIDPLAMEAPHPEDNAIEILERTISVDDEPEYVEPASPAKQLPHFVSSSPPIPTHRPKSVEQLTNAVEIPSEKADKLSEQQQTAEKKVEPTSPIKLTNQTQPLLCTSPPIPTHQPKTNQKPEGQVEQIESVAEKSVNLAGDSQISVETDQKKLELKTSAKPEEQVEQIVSEPEKSVNLAGESEFCLENEQEKLELETPVKPCPQFVTTSPPIPTHCPKPEEKLEQHVEHLEFGKCEIKTDEMKPLQLNMIDSSQGISPTPTSPTFPVKSSPESETPHFPHSPRAPVEQDEMPYLEQAIITSSADDHMHLSGVIAKSPLPPQMIVTQLNETIPMGMGNISPLNGTFDANAVAESHQHGGVLLAEVSHQQRRTFSINLNSNESGEEQQQLNATVFVNDKSPLGWRQLNTSNNEQRRTFNIQPELNKQSEQQLNATVSIAEEPLPCASLASTMNSEQRRTFHVPSEEKVEQQLQEVDDFEPMDVDQSMQMETIKTVIPTTPTAQPIPQIVVPPSPPIPTHQPKQQPQLSNSPPLPTHQKQASPPLPAQLKRLPIHGEATKNPTVPSPTTAEEQTLSAKEQLSASNEKDDIYVEHFGAMSPISDDIFKAPKYTSSSFVNLAKAKSLEAAATADGSVGAGASRAEQISDAEFQDGAGNNIILNSSDFDYLYTKGNSNAPIDRSSLLLKFDPLLGAPVPVNISAQQDPNQLYNNNINNKSNNLPRALSPTLEEQSFVIEQSAKAQQQKDWPYKPPVDRSTKHAKMSVDVIDNDCNKSFDNSNLNLEEKSHKYHNMDELEKKIKNEVTRSEDIEKKLKEAEQREEALVKRITEKDKTNTKLNGVIEAYEKAIAELIHDKEQLVQNHERQMLEVQADRDSNYNHLMSLETTFSDLHVKYEKSKEMTSQMKQVQGNLLEEKKKLLEKLRQQEQRYDQMRSHSMQQLEIANKKLATLTKDHTDEVKKLKALLKKEEVSRISTAEQLQQKSRENADLLKICEELIYDKGQGGSS